MQPQLGFPYELDRECSHCLALQRKQGKKREEQERERKENDSHWVGKSTKKEKATGKQQRKRMGEEEGKYEIYEVKRSIEFVVL